VTKERSPRGVVSSNSRSHHTYGHADAFWSEHSAAAQSAVEIRGNDGFGNGGGNHASGNSTNYGSPNAGQKAEDRVR
jgi:hypothetical protein